MEALKAYLLVDSFDICMYPLIAQLYVATHCSAVCTPSLISCVCSLITQLIVLLCMHPLLSSCVYSSLFGYEFQLIWVCKIAQLYDFGCFNLIWVWGIQICRDTSCPSPLVAATGDLKMAADITLRTILS